MSLKHLLVHANGPCCWRQSGLGLRDILRTAENTYFCCWPRQMRDMPPWFKCLVWMEVALQLPFFFVGAYAFLLRRDWIRTPALLYGINVTSTMVRCRGLLSPRMASASRMLSV